MFVLGNTQLCTEGYGIPGILHLCKLIRELNAIMLMTTDSLGSESHEIRIRTFLKQLVTIYTQDGWSLSHEFI